MTKTEKLESNASKMAREAMQKFKDQFNSTETLQSYNACQKEYNSNFTYNKDKMSNTLFVVIDTKQRICVTVSMPIIKEIDIGSMEPTEDNKTPLKLAFSLKHYDSLQSIYSNIMRAVAKEKACTVAEEEKDEDDNVIEFVLPGGKFEASSDSLKMRVTLCWLRIPVRIYLDVAMKLLQRCQCGVKTSHIAFHVIDPKVSAYAAGDMYENEPRDFCSGENEPTDSCADKREQAMPHQMVISVKQFFKNLSSLDFAQGTTTRTTRKHDESGNAAKRMKSK